MAQFESILGTLFTIYYTLIFAYILLSWLPQTRGSAIGEWLGRIVEPYLTPFRRIIPPIGGTIDISPILALLALRYVQDGIVFLVRFIVGMVS